MCGNALGAPVANDRHWQVMRMFPRGLTEFWGVDFSAIKPVKRGHFTEVLLDGLRGGQPIVRGLPHLAQSFLAQSQAQLASTATDRQERQPWGPADNGAAARVAPVALACAARDVLLPKPAASEQPDHSTPEALLEFLESVARTEDMRGKLQLLRSNLLQVSPVTSWPTFYANRGGAGRGSARQQAPRSSQAATLAAASEPRPSTPPPAKRTKAEQAAEPNKGKGKAQGKAAKAKPAPQPGRWLDRDCNAALNMQRIGESRWRPLELCYWKEQGALPAKGKEYPGLGYERLRDKPPSAQKQQPAGAQ
ncbi:Hflx-type G domain-containing protein [Haematococcus lacustris]|uniref:Hflx-type G domain-containing protein n=1 Tax=Haematococcus lacustris TaxID=44745 RepID=A0A699Z121_HAELA|nr:Hflx-type G domain-containing protein [Haematococcus lacustris]